MVGVPALWQLLHRKMTQELAAQPAFVEEAVKALMAANAELRNKADQFGQAALLAGAPKIRGPHQVSHLGRLGAARRRAQGLSRARLHLSEGLRPHRSGAGADRDQRRATSGCRARWARRCPASSCSIDEPDTDGIGEVIAKGPNVMAGYFEDRDATEAILKNGWLYTGDLGRIDADGRLYLVGRKKDVIIDANGKNVFPDELEELYQAHKHIKELSIVGLPDDAGGEKVACLCVPDYLDRPRDDVRRELEEHFRNVSQDMPFYRRVKILRLWDGELPRTSTRKVKRKLVVDELKRLRTCRRFGREGPETTGVSHPSARRSRRLAVPGDCRSGGQAGLRSNAPVTADGRPGF